ncbi:MAG: hypothetical protein ACYSWU_27690, partial [Planctomycetota bacterium]
ILGAYADSSEEVSAYLQSAFRAVTESAVAYQAAGHAIAAMAHELELATDAGIQVEVDTLLAEANQARGDVKAASAQLETAIMAAAQAGKDGKFDRALEDVIRTALQRLMEANESLFVKSQALTAAVTLLRDARVNGESEIDPARVASTTAQAELAAHEEIEIMRKSWDRAAQDVFSAFVARLAADQNADADPAEFR